MSNGMKQTVVGEIPEGWKVCILGECSIIRGRLGWKGLKQSEYISDGPYMIAGKHISNGRIKWDQCDHIPENRYAESIEIALELGDVIFSKDGSLGNPALISNLPGKATINSTMMLIRVDEKISSDFFYQVLQSAFFKNLVRERVSGSSIPHIFQKDMHSFKFPLPPLLNNRK